MNAPCKYGFIDMFYGMVIDDLSPFSPEEVRSQMIYAMIFSGASAFAMSYASAWCVRSTSSTTYSMVGALNKLPIAASGILFFGDPATFANVTAIIIGELLEGRRRKLSFIEYDQTHV